jgi:3-oxoacyl-[acyl-carrier protein] reductase
MEDVLRVLAREIGEQQSTVNLVAFLASDLAGFISGAFIPVSGGTAMLAI